MSENMVTQGRLLLSTVSSLEKIFPDQPFIPEGNYQRSAMLAGERFSFQIAYCLEGGNMLVNSLVSVSGSLADHVIVRQTGLVPSQLPNYPDGDEHVLRTTPGLYPDPLYPLPDKIKLIPGQWRSLWITVPGNCNLPAGSYELIVTFRNESGTELGQCLFTLERLPVTLPEQTLYHTEWFHSDCIADWYHIPVFSERHWELLEKYFTAAAEYGVNLILTPLFTPPLDTAPGGQRTTVQLVDVYRTESTGENGEKAIRYDFGFDKLERWQALCEKCKIPNLEFSHLFTQWGAEHAPKIMASDNDKELQIFGWDTDAEGMEYREFLSAFLPRLVEYIETHGLTRRCFFHISDEPHKDQLPAYLNAKELITGFTGGLPVMDAISDYDYYEQGLVKIPVCSNNHIEPFLEHSVPDLWTYYCCCQNKDVSNRFFCMPSSRNRILGTQLYFFQIKGFLQWGFNFWNSALSVSHINPFMVTDSGCAFPSGDPFLVYPGEDGPVGSIRGEVLMEGLQDMRAFQLLEQYMGRSAVTAWIAEQVGFPLTFKEYPRSADWLLSFREHCNRKLETLVKIPPMNVPVKS